jgi:excinuclease ABC subunit C
MTEVVYRTKLLVDENQPLPQLIIIDGKRTIVSGTKSDDLGLRGKIAIIGIARDWKNYFIGDSIPLYLDKKSETLK